MRPTVALALLAALVSSPTRADSPDPAQVEFFEAKVRPILADRCLGCHGPDKQKGGLRLDSPDAMRSGGTSGPAVVPGQPDDSLLVEAIRYEGTTRMPPKQRLKDAEVATLTEWVKRGAVWPETKAEVRPAAVASRPITDEDRAFWSFQPIADPAPPTVRDADWARTPIDRFLLAKLEQQGLGPVPPADRRTLIRRVTFDLTGLPPTPEEVDAFLADDSADAYARVVDRLLASPQYGERWARHWLDIARYGEDQAHSFQPRLYPSGYRYRDWLVNAFNHDLPYDQFLRLQIAADLLDTPDRKDNLPALGLFACGPVYYGDAKKFDQIDDRIDTLTRGVLGLTVACARCHDHKYDPIPTADYYALAGVFASTEYDETPLAPPDVVAAYDDAQKAIAARDKEIESFLKGEADRIVAGRVAAIDRYVIAAWMLKALGDRTKADDLARELDLESSLLRRWARYLDDESKADRPGFAAWFALRKQPIPDGFPDRCDCPPVELDEAAAAIGGKLKAIHAERPKDGPDKALHDELLGDKGVLAIAKDKVESLLAGEAKAKLDALKAESKALKDAAPAKYPIAHALKEGKPRNVPVLVRGNADNAGPEASRHFLSVLGGEPLDDGSGRRELAETVASPANPLTARVFVNRVWQHHFGRGLVNTPSNFGALGDRPSHPELLDWLARRFIDSGWSIKDLHRTILLTSAYQQSGRYDVRAFEADPGNALVWRMSRRRLEVEPWRDALLAVAGKLDPAMGGPSFPLDDPAARRRTLYAVVSRHDLAPLLRLFDFPEPNITAAARTETTVPLQQLVVLNDELVVGAARALAARLAAEADSDDARVDRAYALLFARRPTDSERALALTYLAGNDPEGGKVELSRWERYAQALLASNEFLYVD